MDVFDRKIDVSHSLFCSCSDKHQRRFNIIMKYLYVFFKMNYQNLQLLDL